MADGTRTTALAVMFAALLSATAAQAAAPVLGDLAPRGLRRGQATVLTLSGTGLGQNGPEVRATLPGTLGPIKVLGPNQIQVEAKIPGDAPVGFYSIQVRTADGLTSRLPVALGDLPERNEAEPNNLPSQAKAIALPVTISGSSPGSDRDFVRFQASRGQRITIEVEARRLGSGLEPVVTVLDLAGKPLTSDADEIASQGDPRLVFVAPADGEYLAAIQDVRYAGQGNAFYRLKIGDFASADAMFPLGWRRGEPLDARWLGGSLTGEFRTSLTTPNDPTLTYTSINLPAPGPAGASPFKLVLGDRPEAIEPEAKGPHPWIPGSVMNGRLGMKGEVDEYKLAVSPGQTLMFDVNAARLGSKLDGVIHVKKADGTVLGEADDGAGFDPQLTLGIPAGVTEVIVGVRDLLGRGGPAFPYRLTARPVSPDYQLLVNMPAITIPKGASVVVPVQVVRQGINDAIQLSIPSDTPGVTATGGEIPAGANDGSILLSATPGAASSPVGLEIWGSAGPASQPLRRRARLAADGTPQGPNRPGELLAAIGNGPPIVLAAASPSVTLVHGETSRIVIKGTRLDGFKGAVSFTTDAKPAQVAGGGGVMAGDKSEATLSYTTDALTKLGPARLQVVAKTRSGDRDETINLPPLAAEVVRPFSIEVLTPSVTLKPGGKARIVGIVRRIAPFNKPVGVAHEGSTPPPHVTFGDATVAPGDALISLEIAAGPQAAPGTFDYQVRGSTAMDGRKNTKDYVIPIVPVKVTITPADPPKKLSSAANPTGAPAR